MRIVHLDFFIRHLYYKNLEIEQKIVWLNVTQEVRINREYYFFQEEIVNFWIWSVEIEHYTRNSWSICRRTSRCTSYMQVFKLVILLIACQAVSKEIREKLSHLQTFQSIKRQILRIAKFFIDFESIVNRHYHELHSWIIKNQRWFQCDFDDNESIDENASLCVVYNRRKRHHSRRNNSIVD